jgi:hypothetical protein
MRSGKVHTWADALNLDAARTYSAAERIRTVIGKVGYA